MLSSNTEDRNERAHGSSEQGNVALRTWQYPGLRVTEVVCPQEAEQGYVPEAEQGYVPEAEQGYVHRKPSRGDTMIG